MEMGAESVNSYGQGTRMHDTVRRSCSVVVDRWREVARVGISTIVAPFVIT